MRTKDLIRQLQEADPTGEEHVCVHGTDIHFVAAMPAYWDGPTEILIRDHDNPYYNIIGAKMTTKGIKVMIHLLSIKDALLNDPDLPVEVDYTYVDPASKLNTEAWVEKKREEVRKIYKEIEDKK